MRERVFLSVASYQYEGDDVLAVSSTRERALLGFRERCADPDDATRMGCSHDWHFVETWEIDGNCEAEKVFSDAIEEAWASAPARSGGRG